MAYTTVNKSTDYFNTKLFVGNSSTNAITGVGHQPDWTWIKRRDGGNGYSNFLFDAVRGVNKGISSNQTAAEQTFTYGFDSFNSDGFTLGANSSGGGATELNFSGGNYASWNWKAGTSFTNDASSTGIGTIDSAGTVNQDAGFSICSYTGTGSAGTIKHGLNKKPTFWMTKARSETRAWYGWHQGFALGSVVNFNSTNAASSDSSLFSTNAPTSSVYNVGSSPGTNNNGITFINYLFHDVEGYSKFGTYSGNGNADGQFIYTGFKPALTIIKNSSGTGPWYLFDNKRPGFNVINVEITANSSDAEATDISLDYLSNGFKLRKTGSGVNGSGNTYIYMAFGQSLVGTNNIPNNAF